MATRSPLALARSLARAAKYGARSSSSPGPISLMMIVPPTSVVVAEVGWAAGVPLSSLEPNVTATSPPRPITMRLTANSIRVRRVDSSSRRDGGGAPLPGDDGGALVKELKQFSQVGREGRLELEPLARRRMVELQLMGMQERPAQRERLSRAAIAAVADHRVTQRPQMDPHLVGPTRFERALHQCHRHRLLEPLEHLVAGARLAT